MIRYDAVFEKKGDMVYISHLDLMTLMRRAIRRTGLAFVLTEGFSPHVKISMPKALKLGRQSGREEMSFWLTEEYMGGGEETPAQRKPSPALKEILNRELPEGVRILEVARAK